MQIFVEFSHSRFVHCLTVWLWIYSAVPLRNGQLSPKCSQQTPHCSPIKAYTILCYIGPRFNGTLVYNIRGRSQRYFAHVTTVSLSWRVQNIVVIGQVHSKLEHSEFSSNFEFDRNMLSGTGAWLVCLTKNMRNRKCITYSTMVDRCHCHYTLCHVKPPSILWMAQLFCGGRIQFMNLKYISVK